MIIYDPILTGSLEVNGNSVTLDVSGSLSQQVNISAIAMAIALG
jgi:hypothetical protein